MYSDAERKAIMREARENIRWAKEIERDRIERLQRIPLPDPMVLYRQQADAQKAAEQAETQRRIREAKREQRERERAMVESAAVTELRGEVEALRGAIDAGDAEVLNVVETAIIPLVEHVGDSLQGKINKISEKLSELERLLNRLRSMSETERAQPMDLPPLRSLRQSRDMN